MILHPEIPSTANAARDRKVTSTNRHDNIFSASQLTAIIIGANQPEIEITGEAHFFHLRNIWSDNRMITISNLLSANHTKSQISTNCSANRAHLIKLLVNNRKNIEQLSGWLLGDFIWMPDGR